MNKDRVIVLGRGFLGKQFERNGFRVLGRRDFVFDKDVAGFTPNSFTALNNIDSYDVIINTIGKANTRWCQEECNWEEVLSVNGFLPSHLSKFCRENGKKFVHISSGCVYDKNNRPQTEDDSITSHVRYVVSKIVGEYGCDTSRDLILRPRLFFGDSYDANNLLCKLKKFSRHLTEINSFTSVQTIVEATESLLKNKQCGVYNVSNKGFTSIQQICNFLGLRGIPISGEDLRDLEGLHLVNSIMDTSKLESFYNPPEIFEEVGRCWDELHSN